MPDVPGSDCIWIQVYNVSMCSLGNLKTTVEAVAEAGLRDEVRIMIGGCAVDEGVREFAGADAYGKDAVAALNLVKGWTKGVDE